MNEDQLKRLSELERKWLDNTISPEEEKEYLDWINKEEEGQGIYLPSEANEEAYRERLFHTISSRIAAAKADPETVKAMPRIVTMFSKRALRYAAAIVLFLGLGTYVWLSPFKTEKHATVSTQPQHSIVPGSDKATLTLSDGTTIILDSVSTGKLAVQEGANVIKLTNGQIAYKSYGNTDHEVLNTMTTPKGGKYQLILPDGSQVWLNSASSITYPTAFTGRDRKIKISGEVYFDVAKNKNRPFIVNVSGKSVVEVLGTQFNVNSYEDEDAIKTTLIEGSVKVLHGSKNVILKPGQQSQQAEHINVVNQLDVEQVIAWKNGYFNFNDVSIQKAMMQIARWYDIEVIYQGKIPDDVLVGKIPMGASITKVLNILEKIGVRFTVEGKKIIVTS